MLKPGRVAYEPSGFLLSGDRIMTAPPPVIERLLKRREFLAVAATGVKWVRPAFVIQFLKHPELAVPTELPADTEPPVARIGFTVSKKQGNAVRRNRIRRRLREAARLGLAEVVQPGCDYVIIGRFAADEIPFDQLKLELAAAVSRLHALKPGSNSRLNRPKP